MKLFVVLTPEQLALEREADRLLGAQPRDPERPAYTERQLARRGPRLISVDALAEQAVAPSQPLRDELRFLASVSRLEPGLRLTLRLWIEGWSQQEIAAACHLSQQRVSQRIQKALRVCYDNAPLSFRQFSHHTLSRKLRRSSRTEALRRCVECGEAFLASLGCGRYCSTLCHEAAAHTAQERMRRRGSRKKAIL